MQGTFVERGTREDRRTAIIPEPGMTTAVIGDDRTETHLSMADPAFVESMVKAMALHVRNALFAGPDSPAGNPQELLPKIAEKYRDMFYAGNKAYQQTFTPEAQAVWLQSHDLGTDETDPRQIAGCLAVATIQQLSSAMIAHAEGQINDKQLQFRLDVAIEDCTAMLLGIENPAD